MSHLTKQQLTTLASKLRNEQQLITARLSHSDHYGLKNAVRNNLSELSTLDNHPGDLGTEMYERAKDLALCEHDELHLTRINTALQRINDGTYGKCETCNAPISIERLNAVPDTIYCVQHSPQSAVSEQRPIEEQLLTPPFGRTSLDGRDDPGFDGEDAWQIVEGFGTSNSPAFSEDTDVDNYSEMEIEAQHELDGFVEPYESFVATDIYGQNIYFYRNNQYHKYMHTTKQSDSEANLSNGSNTY